MEKFYALPLFLQGLVLMGMISATFLMIWALAWNQEKKAGNIIAFFQKGFSAGKNFFLPRPQPITKKDLWIHVTIMGLVMFNVLYFAEKSPVLVFALEFVVFVIFSLPFFAKLGYYYEYQRFLKTKRNLESLRSFSSTVTDAVANEAQKLAESSGGGTRPLYEIFDPHALAAARQGKKLLVFTEEEQKVS